MNKRSLAVTLKLSEEEVELFRIAGVVLYGRNHPVSRSTLVRELAKRGAQQVIKKAKTGRGGD